MVVWIILFVVATLMFALSAVSGGGAGLILMPVLGLLLPPAGVPAALSIGTAVSSMSRIALFFQNIRWAVVLRFVPLALPAAWGGVLLLKQVQPVYLDLLLGLFLLGNLPLLLRRSGKEQQAQPKADRVVWLPVIGALAGFISGFTGAVGLLFNRFYHQLGLSKHQIVATRAANDVLLHLVKVFLYLHYGLITRSVLTAGLVVALAALLSSVSMKRVLRYVPDHLFRQVGHGSAVLAGLAMMGIAGSNILTQEQVALYYVQGARAQEDSKLVLDWRQHRLTFEVEKPVELEIHDLARSQWHLPAASECAPEAPSVILHLSPVDGVYVTHRQKGQLTCHTVS
ncbi:sulfite exporter TauE/SafE family protein [Acetobacter farinalis]|uniref:Probable membrane transporter protein n=1 Tax=Acetobacter farinalis TaxID=1260984 RepID=A0ABT3Q7B5_9PROT|nr:sulfite exporter TauE/SafE family protein [Acetobacter farinalis]MCX2561170.1 sulfite exporter TauE/SafE family protein [Acetobacter farinalis]NHO29860.1 TSUP family transporter [Acetobacter farinalis]